MGIIMDFITVERLAELANNINTAYCVWLGDNSKKYWTDLTEEEKKSVISGVKYVQKAHWGSSLNEKLHNNWMAEKLQDGWRYGYEKDLIKKTHPCLLPYDFLPLEQKLKDQLFKNVVTMFVNRLDIKDE